MQTAEASKEDPHYPSYDGITHSIVEFPFLL